VLVFGVLGPGAAQAAPLTALERQHLIAHIEMTDSWLIDMTSLKQ